MTREKLKSRISEAIYEGNIGIHELMMFYQSADASLKHKVESLFNTDNTDQAWHVIKDYLQTQGKLLKIKLEKKNKNRE